MFFRKNQLAKTILAILFFSLLCFACKVDVIEPIKVESVSITGSSSLTVGETKQFTAEVLPADAVNKTVSWSSSNTTVATVDSNGLVTAKTAGSTTISVKTVDGNKTANYNVTVTEPIIPVETISINMNSSILLTEEPIEITFAYTPQNASIQDVKWVSSKTSVASISNVNGKYYLNPVAEGQTTITLSVKNSAMGQALSTSKAVTITPEIKQIENISITTNFDDVFVGDPDLELTYTFAPENATIQNVSWTSSDTSVASIYEENGKFYLKPLKAGATEITVSAKNSAMTHAKTDSKTIVVKMDSIDSVPNPEPTSLPTVSNTGAKIIFDAATGVNTIGNKTWGDEVLSDYSVNGKTVKKVSVTDSMPNKVAVHAITKQSWKTNSKLYFVVYSNADIQVAAKGGEGNDRFSSFNANGIYAWRTFEVDLNSYNFTETDQIVLGSKTAQDYYIASIYIVEPASEEITPDPEPEPDPENNPEIPATAPDITIPSGAYVIHNSANNVSTFGAALNWNAGSTIMSEYTYKGTTKKAKKVDFTKNSSYDAFYVTTKFLDTSASPKLHMSVYAAHDFSIKAMPTDREDLYTVTQDGKWEWKTIEYDMGSASEITMICFVSAAPQSIFVDKVYVTGVKAGQDSSSGGNQPSADLTGISISGPDTVKVTNQITLSATAIPAEASLGTVDWSSSNENATVSNKGTVTGLKTGTVTITATAGSFSATKIITITEDVDPESAVQSPSDITSESGYTTPFGIVLDGNVGNGQFSICSGGGMTPMPSYWILFITGGDLQNKKVKLNTNGVVNVKVGKAGNYDLKLYNVWVEDGIPHYSNPWTGSVNVTTNSVTQALPPDAEARLANRTLVKKKDTTTLTVQFENNTGYWEDDEIWVTGYGRNAIGEWCYLNKDGTAIPITAGTTSKDWSFRFSDVDPEWGLQCKDFSSSRIYFTCGDEPVTMNAVIDANGNIGVAQPNMAIENDDNATKYFDWIEFTAGGVLYVNTTQVDAFTFPIVVADYAEDGMGGYEWKKSVGVTKSRKEVFEAWNTWTNKYTHYRNLVRCNGTRILAPCKVPKTDFDMTYMDEYIADVWNYYKTHDLHYSEKEHGTYTGRVHEIMGVDGNIKNVLIMTRASDGAKFYVYDTPNMEEAFEGSGRLAEDCSPAQSLEWFGTTEYGNTETSKNVQNRICSAFTRHAFIKQSDGSYINVMDDPSRYYSEEPANMYSAFFHKEAGNLDGYAYGFAYDDNHDQSTTTVDENCRGIVVGIGRWE